MPQAVISRLEEEEEEGGEESGFEDLCEDLLCKSWKVFDRCDLVKEQVRWHLNPADCLQRIYTLSQTSTIEGSESKRLALDSGVKQRAHSKGILQNLWWHTIS